MNNIAQILVNKYTKDTVINISSLIDSAHKEADMAEYSPLLSTFIFSDGSVLSVDSNDLVTTERV